MEISLEWNSEDSFLCNLNDTFLSILNKSKYTLSNLDIKKDYIIQDKNIIDKRTLVREIFINQKNILKIIPSPDLVAKIKNLLAICRKKEQKLSEIKKLFEKLKKETKLNEELLNKKFLSLILEPNLYCLKIREKILNYLSNVDEFSLVIEYLKRNIMNFKKCKFFTLYFKLIMERTQRANRFLLLYGIIFSSNEQTLKTSLKSYANFLGFITKEEKKEILSGLGNCSVYANNIQKFNEGIDLLNYIIRLIPFSNLFDNTKPQILFSSIESPINLPISQIKFDEMRLIGMELYSTFPIEQKLNRKGIDEKLEQFTEMFFNRIIYFYQKYGILFIHLLYASLLYEEEN